jgi:two-component sensor histidine kinase
MTPVIPIAVEAASTLAVIAASNEPLLFLNGDMKLIAASASFCHNFQIEPAGIPGRVLSELGAGEWGSPQLASLLSATASGNAFVQAYEMNLVRKDQPTRCLLMNATKLDDGDKERVRLLLAITDVTVARAESRQKDDLIREKAILLQEVQHRVANSLQIIASVLMQSARMVQSAEARGHLHDAHNRVMSIAAVQRHLSVARVGDVPLRPYFTQLCESLGASMIHDQKRLSIVTNVDESTANANVSVGLGLIVTELVINALKHGFPDQRAGVIRVDYKSSGPEWTLTVKDDGVGIPEHTDPKPGLGTGIVEALSGQLEATVTISDAQPGVTVAITHTEEKL